MSTDRRRYKSTDSNVINHGIRGRRGPAHTTRVGAGWLIDIWKNVHRQFGINLYQLYTDRIWAGLMTDDISARLCPVNGIDFKKKGFIMMRMTMYSI